MRHFAFLALLAAGVTGLAKADTHVQGGIDTTSGSARSHGDLFPKAPCIRPVGRVQVGTASEVAAPLGEAPLSVSRPIKT